MKRLAVVMVTFAPRGRLERHVSALSAQSSPPDLLIIVNTGPEQVRLAAAKFPIRVMDMKDIGPAGGFREGAKAAYAAGYDGVIFADDDAVPARPDALECFREDAEKGMDAVAGYYTTGAPVALSNHYLMASREVLRRCGFYFPQFFLGSEDMEFPDRIRKHAAIRNDGRIIIAHPSRMTLDAQRTYYFMRNFSAHMAMSGSARAYLFSFLAYFVRCSFISLSMGKPGFMKAFILAGWDFAGCRLGKRHAIADRMVLREPGLKDGRGCVVVRSGNGAIPLPPALAGSEAEEPGADNIFDSLVGDGRRAGVLSKLVAANRMSSGRRLVLASHHFLAFPPFSLLAKSVYVYEETEGTVGLLRDNSPAASIALTLLFAPLGLLLALPALLVFYMRRGAYRKMMDGMLGSDAEFCREADRALGGGKGA